MGRLWIYFGALIIYLHQKCDFLVGYLVGKYTSPLLIGLVSRGLFFIYG
ncbi:hypothetical protein O59_002386 [Cellvibrio sp. BR]|nr:hypothetical protein O59_002386 [Cellvibrio sp. BR]